MKSSPSASSCKPHVVCRLKKAPVTPDSELTALHDEFPALSVNVITKTRMLKSLLDVLRFYIDAISLFVTTFSTSQDGDTKVHHSLFKMMQKNIHGLQDQLASFKNVTEKLENDLWTST